MISQQPQTQKNSNIGLVIMLLVLVTLGLSMWWANVTYAGAMTANTPNTAVVNDWLSPLLLAGGIVSVMIGYVIWRRR